MDETKRFEETRSRVDSGLAETREASQPYRVFAHLQADNAPLYRGVMRVFTDAKAQFTLHLRPREVTTRLGAGSDDSVLDPEQVERALEQLVSWGNLESHPDTADVATAEDFYRRRQLYQLTHEGEAAELALETFRQNLGQEGELQTAALTDVRALLEELIQLSEAEPLDAGKVHRTLRALVDRFTELTQRAQAFIGSLQRTIDLQGITVEHFLSYKERLIEYLDHFVNELILATSEITALLRRLAEAGTERLLRIAADRDLADAVAVDEASRAAALDAWRQRWRGLVAWFLDPEGTPQAEVLRSRARGAIPALLGAVEALHDRRVKRSDRISDLRTLARWFATCDDERQAHRLWRAAFGLGSSRHLRIDAATLDRFDQLQVPNDASWLEAPPLLLTPRLRKTGRYTRRGRAARIVDRGREKAHLAELAAAEAAQIGEARKRLARGEFLRLSEIGHLDHDSFALFLDLLGEALARRTGESKVLATSSDGALEIELEPLDHGTAVIDTPHGRFSGRDHRVRIRALGAEPTSVGARGDATTGTLASTGRLAST